jgi:hypothetical protein
MATIEALKKLRLKSKDHGAKPEAQKQPAV